MLIRVKQYISYYRLFTFKFLVRAFIVRLLRVYVGEVRQLDIADELLARRISVRRLKGGRMHLATNLNGIPLDIQLRRNTSDLLVFNQVLLKTAYQPLLELVNVHFRGQIKTIVDVGGNIGLTSLFFKCHFPEAIIFVMEPSPRNFVMMRENLKTNAKTAVLCQQALLASGGRVSVENSFRDKLDWSTNVVLTGLSSDIEAVSLTHFKHEHGIKFIDILKIDIEGHEAELFASKDFLLELKSVRFLALEVHEEKADRISIINCLQAVGFVLVYRSETVFGFNPAAL